jgi:hypothetical protein
MSIPNTPNYYAQQSPVFQRAMRNILSITQAQNALVTTTFDGVNPGNHQYSTGLIARLYIPYGFGMVQANQLSGTVTVINDTQFTITIDTTNFDAFVVPAFQPGNFGTPAQVVPVGEINSILTEATQNVLNTIQNPVIIGVE